MKKNIRLIAIICLLFCLVYTFFATKPLTSELSFKSEWTINVIKSNTPPQQTNGENFLPFRLGQSLGYFSKDGQIVLLENFPVKATITKDFYSCFGYDSSEFEVYSNTGERLGKIQKSGFPFFQEDRLYLLSPGGSSVMQLDLEGKEFWRFENYCPLTAFSSSKAGSIAGFADGTIYTFDNGGKTASYSPGGSKYPVILGVAISQSGKYTACVSGQEKQRFVLFAKSGAITKVIFHEYLEKDTTKQVLVSFSKDDRYVFYDFKGGLGIHDIQTGKTGHIGIAGDIQDIRESSQRNLFFVLAKDEDEYTVYAIEPLKSQIGSFSFLAKHAFIQTQEDSLFVGRDDQISKLIVTKQ